MPHSATDFDLFHEELCRQIVLNTTTRTVRASQSKHNQPWFTQELRSLKRSLKFLYKMKLDYPSNPNYLEEYTNLRRLYRQKIDTTKAEYFANLFGEQLNNPSKLWKLTNQLISNKFQETVSQKIVLDTGQGTIDDNLLVANFLNHHFVNIPNNMSRNFDTLDGETLYTQTTSGSLQTFSPTDSSEVRLIITQLKTKSSPGSDKVPVSFLKDNIDFFAQFLSDVANNMFETGSFPSCLKTAIVTPIFKKGSRKDPNNYRPISVLSVFSKVFEMLIKSRLLNHLSLNNLISKNQYGFLKKRSTTGAVASLIDKVLSSLNDKQKTSSLFLDIAKAFDCLNYEVLRSILIKYGITEVALNLIMSFLSNRTQSVKVNSKISSPLSILGGLPQGSCLVILFLVYINDLLNLPLIGLAQLYCDDAVVTYSAPDFMTLKAMMTQDLQTITEFFQSRLPQINTSKSNFIVFTTRNSPTSDMFHSITYNNNSIRISYVHDYLGLQIDSKLSFHAQENSPKIDAMANILFSYSLTFHISATHMVIS